MNTNKSWIDKPIFLSSTFLDMHAERDYLQSFIFPELEERMSSIQAKPTPVDLRWGVYTLDEENQERRELLTLQVCLREIDRCRPYMIVLLGDRYGWVPPVQKIKSALESDQFLDDYKDISVTALEIEYGLREPGHCFYYFRAPLPYDSMAIELVDKYSDINTKPDQFARLRLLKEKLKMEQAARVRTYTVGWDSDNQRVIGLEEFGKMVLEDLWTAIKKEIGETSAISRWEEEEEHQLDNFFSSLRQNFVGRKEELEEVLASEKFITCITGPSGSGKSAMLAKLAKEFNADSFILFHSAGVSHKSRQLELMLQRWCFQLATYLGQEVRDFAESSYESLVGQFDELLRRVAQSTPIILLVDALDQFERTEQAKYVNWLPKPPDWPQELRLIASTNEGTELQEMKARLAKIVVLPPLSKVTGQQLSNQICRRFGKELPDPVTQTLVNRDAGHADHGAGSPLWLTLVTNELILLDAEDFTRLSSLSGDPESKIVELLQETIREIPIEPLNAYLYLFNRLSETYGEQKVKDLILLLSLNRAGLRESDFAAVYSSVSGIEWDQILFALVRRALRAHLNHGGDNGRWAFSHNQAFEAAKTLASEKGESLQRCHATLARHLLSLDEKDPMRLEAMKHLILAGDAKIVAANWVTDGGTEVSKAHIQEIKDFLLNSSDNLQAIDWLLSMLKFDHSDEFNTVLEFFYAEKILEFTEKAELFHDAPGLLKTLLSRMIEIMQADVNDDNYLLKEQVLYRAQQNLSELLEKSGDYSAALEVLRQAQVIVDDHAEGRRKVIEDDNFENDDQRDGVRIFFENNQRDRMLNYWNIAGLLRLQGKPEDSSDELGKALEIAEWFLEKYPASELSRADMAKCRMHLAELAEYIGDSEDAKNQWQKCIGYVIDLVDENPANKDYINLLTLALPRLVDYYIKQHEIEQASALFLIALQKTNAWTDLYPGDINGRQRHIDILLKAELFWLRYGNIDAALNLASSRMYARRVLLQSQVEDLIIQYQLYTDYSRAAGMFGLIGFFQAAEQMNAEAAQLLIPILEVGVQELKKKQSLTEEEKVQLSTLEEEIRALKEENSHSVNS